MAHKKGVGSSRNGRDSNAKRLGIKVTDGQSILAGGIILRQRGTKTARSRSRGKAMPGNQAAEHEDEATPGSSMQTEDTR